MRILNLRGRLHIMVGDQAVDVERASGGRFASDPQAVYAHWREFREWSQNIPDGLGTPVDADEIGPPVPGPRQVFALGLNYRDHAAESGEATPEQPLIFTKFASSITGPRTTVELPAGNVDWEVELVAVMGIGGRNIAASKAWDHVAGLTVGQDLSERLNQHAGRLPQFSLAKSHEGFSPIGPYVVSVDELDDPDDLEIKTVLDGETVQNARTSSLVFTVPEIIEYLSMFVELYPGDLIFTGTPSGVGASEDPPRFLKDGNVLRTVITGIGELEQVFVDPSDGKS